MGQLAHAIHQPASLWQPPSAHDLLVLSLGHVLRPTDLGEKYIKSFFQLHTCNRFCRPEWATAAVGGRPSGDIEVQQSTTFQMSQPEHAPPCIHMPPLKGRKTLK